MRAARALLLTALPATVALAASAPAASAAPVLVPGHHGTASGLVVAQAAAPTDAGLTDAEIEALWAAALAESEGLDREASNAEDGEPPADDEPDAPDVDEDDQDVEDDSDEEESTSASRAAAAAAARAGRTRLVTAKVSGAGKRRRIVATCAKASAKKACVGTVQARGAKGQVLKSWKVRVKNGGKAVLRAPAASRKVTVVRAA